MRAATRQIEVSLRWRKDTPRRRSYTWKYQQARTSAGRRSSMMSMTWTEDGARSTLEPQLQRLLAQTVNSPIKLQLVLLFHENPRLAGSAREIIQRIYRDIWSTREALRELAGDGILDVVERAGEPIYSYRPHAEYRMPIARLAERFNDPFAREEIHAMLRDYGGGAAQRHERARSVAEAATCACGCPILYDSIHFAAS
jgi:hypothetical protein